jgi:phosphoglycerate-specific signal transduction histidine kinase
MDGSNKLPLFFEKQPFAVRLTGQEITFVKENFDELFDGDITINPRTAFIGLCDKALIKVSKTNQSLPADKQLIEQLEKELGQLKSKHNEITAQFNSCVELKADLEKKLEDASAQIELLSKQSDVTPELQVLQQENLRLRNELEKPFELKPEQRLLTLTPLESFILDQIEKVHNTDAKDILINRFFNIYQDRGNGDYDIKRIAPGAMQKIKRLYSSAKTE